MTATMMHWFVTSPTYPYHEVVLEDGSGPTYDVSDYAEVDAPTRREAVVAAVKQWLAENHDTWPQQQRSDGRSPFTGVRAVSEAEAKAEARMSRPDYEPDMCDRCGVMRAEGLRWEWNDDPVEWGWRGVCAGAHQRPSP